MRLFVLLAVAACFAFAPLDAAAEEWPSLETFVEGAELVVLAKVVAIEDGRVTLEPVDTLAGDLDKLAGLDDAGQWLATQGQHGLDADVGQQVVMWYTSHNQPEPGQYTDHNTAFPVSDDDTFVYASTGDEGEAEKLTLAELRKRLAR